MILAQDLMTLLICFLNPSSCACLSSSYRSILFILCFSTRCFSDTGHLCYLHNLHIMLFRVHNFDGSILISFSTLYSCFTFHDILFLDWRASSFNISSSLMFDILLSTPPLRSQVMLLGVFFESRQKDFNIILYCTFRKLVSPFFAKEISPEISLNRGSIKVLNIFMLNFSFLLRRKGRNFWLMNVNFFLMFAK